MPGCLFLASGIHPMNLGCAQVELAWKDIRVISVSLPVPYTIISGSKGRVSPGTITAVLGPSGSGKTTLLNAIAGHLRYKSEAAGEVFLNGHVVDPLTWEQTVGFVPRRFHAHPNQTVAETLSFALRMSYGGPETEEFVENLASEMMDALGLRRVKENTLNAISAGELKRLYLGVILVKNPSVLILDEPISDLDSFNAMHMLELLKLLAAHGKSLLLSIQQPSSKTLKYFDKIMLICQGEIIFDGRVDACIKFFRSCGYTVPKSINPSDFFLEITQVNKTSPELEQRSMERIRRLRSKWENISPGVEVHQVEVPRREAVLSNPLYKFMHLVRRSLVEFVRNREYLGIFAVQKIVMLVLLTLVYLRLGYTQDDIKSRIGVQSFIVINSFEKNLFVATLNFERTKKILKRELCAGMYGAYVGIVAELCSKFITTSLANLAYLSIAYWIIGLNPGFFRFVIFLLVLVCVSFFCLSLSIVIAIHTNNGQHAFVLSTTYLSFFTVFSGTFVDLNTIPHFIRWMVWLSPMYYAFQAIVQSQFSGERFVYKGDAFPVLETGKDILDYYGLDKLGYKTSLCILFGISLAMCLLTLVIGDIKLRPKVVSEEDFEQ
jgi:ATP-binding cassette, subfamily G (WHITE), eye pigment precursor transporter